MNRRSFVRGLAAATATVTGTAVVGDGRLTHPCIPPARESVLVRDAVMRGIATTPRDSSVLTGFADLDAITGGLRRRSVTAIVGRPCLGKSILTLNIAEHIAFDKRLPVVVFSAPAGFLVTFSQLLSSLSGVDQQTLRLLDQPGNGSDRERVFLAADRVREAPLLIDDELFLTATEVRNRALAFARDCGQRLGLIVVDQPDVLDRGDSPTMGAAELGGVMVCLKAIAEELDVPVLITTRIGRQLEQRHDKPPRIADLHPLTIPIAKIADLVLLVYRDEIYTENLPDRGTAEIIVARNRYGRTGIFRLNFRGECARFETFSGGLV